MSPLQWGLIFDFLGSLLLTLHIFGVERVRKFEQNILNFPIITWRPIWRLIEKKILNRLFLGFFSTPYDRGQKLMTSVNELKRDKNGRYAKSSPVKFHETSDRLFLIPIFKSLLVITPLIICFWIIAFVPFIVLRILLFFQKLSKADNFFGFTGLLLLAFGFLLQLLSTAK